MAVATFSSTRPCIVWGTALAASTISIARPTSARASPKVLPISRVTARASSSWWASSTCRKPNSQRARSIVERLRQAGKAARAAATAASTSDAPDSGTRASSSPVAGLVTSSWSPAWAGRQSPSM